jgi:RNA polymerase sigma factor (sigma-70 family)
MATTTLGNVLHELRRSLLCHDEAGHSDGELLECFIGRRDEAAFELLLRRHGPMVLGVCRRVLRNEADAEDAFQATFLVLVRKAGSIRPRGMVGNWLYGVAHSTALKARAMSTKRQAKEREAAARPKPKVATDKLEELHAMLDQELSTLPDIYRAAIVLCDLEGKTIKEAAQQLGCPQGTLGTRLLRGRTLLSRRLARHGLTVSGGVIATAIAQNAAVASVPPLLMKSTIKAATLAAAGQAVTAGVISTTVVTLTEGVLKTMLLTKLKWTAVALVLLAAVTAGIGTASQQLIAQTREPDKAAAEPPAADTKDAPKEPEWGEPDGGVRIRAQAAKKEWRADERIEFVVDLNNEKGGELTVYRLPSCEVEVDGTWYIPVMERPVAGAFVLRQGEIHERIAVVRLEHDKWVLKSAVKNRKDALRAFADPKNRLELTPGKHAIRVACPVGTTVRQTETRNILPVSKPVEITVVDPKKEPPVTATFAEDKDNDGKDDKPTKLGTFRGHDISTAADARKSPQFNGSAIIRRVDEDSLSLYPADDNRLPFSVPARIFPETKVTVDGKPGRAADLAPGAKVKTWVVHDTKDNQFEVVFIETEREPAAQFTLEAVDPKASTIAVTVLGTKAPVLVMPLDPKAEIRAGGKDVKRENLRIGSRVALMLDTDGKTVKSLHIK